MSFRDVCRLCLSTKDLIWIFNGKMTDNMREIIQATSGVEINKTDSVTQMVCSTCCQITIKMYKFRTTSIKNDKDLKAQCADYNISQLTSSSIQSSKKEIKTVNELQTTSTPQQTLKEITRPNEPETTCPLQASKNESTAVDELQPPEKEKTIPVTNGLKINTIPKLIPAKYKTAHPSVKELVKKYPNLILPDECLKSHVGAYITLSATEIDDWLGEALELKDKRSSSKRRLSVSSSSSSFSSRSFESRSPSPIKKMKFDKIEVSKQTKVQSKPKMDDSSSSDQSKTNSEINLPILSTLFTEGTSNSESTDKNIRKRQRFSKVLNDDMEFENRYATPMEIPTDSDDEVPPNEELCSTPEVDDPPNEIPPTSPKDSESRNQVFPTILDDDEPSTEPQPPSPADDEWFTSRPLLNNSETDPNIANCSEYNPITVDTESRSSFDSITLSTDSRNTMDSSLLSVKPKTCSLYTCKVCDAQLTKLKDLQTHIKKLHTKCPFCNKKCKTLQLRDEHVKSECFINASPIKMKIAKLDLVRVNEIEELRKKYTSAFERIEKDSEEDLPGEKEHNEEEDSQNDKNTGEVTPAEETAEQVHQTTTEVLTINLTNDDSDTPKTKKPSEPKRRGSGATKTKHVQHCVPCDKETEQAVLELEKFLKISGVFSVPNENDKTVQGKQKKNVQNGKPVEISEVICISDEETEPEKESNKEPDKETEPDKNSSKEPAASVNPPPLVYINKETTTTNDTSTRRIKVVNSEVLDNIDIHANDIDVLKRILKNNATVKSTAKEKHRVLSLTNNPIEDGGTNRMKVFRNLRKHLDCYKIPIEVKFSDKVSVDYKLTSAPPRRKLSDLWKGVKPIDLKPIPKPPKKIAIFNRQPPMMSVLKSNQRNNATVFQSSGFTTVQDNVVSTTNLMLGSAMIGGGSVTTTPVMLNGTTSLCNAGGGGITILVPNSLLPSTQQTTLPHQLAPLPVIQSVHSIQITNEQSTSNAVVPTSVSVLACTSSESTTVSTVYSVTQSSLSTSVEQPSAPQSAIRVKNLSELS